MFVMRKLEQDMPVWLVKTDEWPLCQTGGKRGHCRYISYPLIIRAGMPM
jgi:hypothetical protein